MSTIQMSATDSRLEMSVLLSIRGRHPADQLPRGESDSTNCCLLWSKKYHMVNRYNRENS